MNENPNLNAPGETKKTEPEIIVNDYGTTRDSAVVVEEETRTVLLTDKETIVIDKEPRIDIVPKNRPRKVYAGMWGPAEIATVGMAMLAILAVIVLYTFFVLPSQKELTDNKAKRDRLQKDLNSAKEKYGSITTTEEQVAKLVNSVDDFEGRVLRFDAIGKPALYQRLNGLIAAYSLVNTTGPLYAPLETMGQQTQEDKGKSKFQSIFPGVYVTTTLEGSYQNLRRFIREVETSNEFIVITAVELEAAEKEEKDNPNQAAIAQSQPNQPAVQNPSGGKMNPNMYQQPPQAMPTAQTETISTKRRGKTSGEIVALRIEMAAYFRRPNYQPILTADER
jgi:Tfp pilus assembly protein PilO